MCGIAGRFHATALRDAPGWRERASTLLAHRGPDGAGTFRDERCELVHRRLALLDLSPTGHQPMANEDGGIQVVFNGEIYNHPELRRFLLQRGHIFRGTSDTECLVHLYEEEGDAMVERLRGIFAFAVYDRPRRRLLLARDRFGVKPLFVAQVAGAWVFASELKAIAAAPGFVARLDRQACYDFLGLGYIPEPATGFLGVEALPAGSTLAIDAAGARRTCYHTPDVYAGATSMDAATALLEERLVDAAGRQSVADVPVAALLSGGIDSSLVVAARARATGGHTTTFNVRFPDPRHDETAVARRVAEHCATRHHTVDIAPQALSGDAILGLLRHFDQPFADTSLIPMYHVSTAIRAHGIICALSGDGGDEAFGGYARFWRANRLHALMRTPAWLRNGARALGATLAPRTADLGRQLAKAVELAEDGLADSAVLLNGLSSYLSEGQKAELVSADARQGLLGSARLFDGWRPPGTESLEELSRRMTATLFRVSLPSDMLRKVDMMSMRASIEVRVPLLDEAVVELGLTLPHALKTDGRTGKRVLRSLAARWLPRDVARHPKHGFSIPLDVMVPDDLHTAARDMLSGSDARTRGVVDAPLVRGWLDEFAAARHGNSGGAISRAGLYQRVMTLLSLELWMRDHALSW